jgi:hypothetical protein
MEPENSKMIDAVERELIDASVDIGMIHECNCYYTYGLARIVWELGKPVEELTIKELRLLHKQYGEKFNGLYRIAEAEEKTTPHQPLPLRGEATAEGEGVVKMEAV